MIQMLTCNKRNENFEGRDMVINTFHDAQSLDEFEINIVNLNSEVIWRNTRDNKRTVNIEEDLISLNYSRQYKPT